MSTWVLVTDSSRARLFEAGERESDWSLLEQHEHPEGRETSRELRPGSPPGRMQQNTPLGGRTTAMEPQTTPKQAEALHFAEQLADRLDSAAGEQKFDRLVLVAAPHFLGLLKGKLGRQAAKRLSATIDKDFSTLSNADIRKKLLELPHG